MLKNLLDLPILYLSRYIIKNKSDYYRLLQEVRTEDNWHEWIMYMLDGVEQTSLETIKMVNGIDSLMKETKYKLREELPKIYSKDLLEVIFSHPYTKIDFLVEELRLHRETASKYLKEMEKIGIFQVIQIGRTKFFINIKLFDLLKKGVQ